MADDLDRFIQERASKNPLFEKMVLEALEVRNAVKHAATGREERGLTQTLVAARMGTSAAAINRIEKSDGDVKLSTLARYAVATGRHLRISFEEDPDLIDA